jgi:hypothetical protein
MGPESDRFRIRQVWNRIVSEFDRFVIRQVRNLTGSVSVIRTAKLELSSVIDNAESKLGSVYDAAM